MQLVFVPVEPAVCTCSWSFIRGARLVALVRAMNGSSAALTRSLSCCFSGVLHRALQLGSLSPASLAALAQAMRALAAQPSLSWVFAFVCAAYPRLDQFDGGQLNNMFEALPALAGDAAGTHWLDDMVQICCYELPARQAQRAALAAAGGGGVTSAASGAAAVGSASGQQQKQKQKQRRARATQNGKVQEVEVPV